jgi:GNAT superfamily N-acetyltransferase
MLLPEATGASRKSLIWVAVEDASPQRVIGAASLGLDRRPETRRGWQVDARVIAPLRRRGIGRKLIEHVCSHAAAHTLTCVFAREWVEPASETAAALRAMGFQPAQQRHEFFGDLRLARERLSPLYAQVCEAGWIPPGAQIVPLKEADANEVLHLHLQYLGGDRRLIRPLLTGQAPDAYHPTYSRVLMLDGRAVGFTLGRVSGNVCEIDANVLHPSVRMGWANLLLKMEATDVLLRDGIDTIHYFTLQQHSDTQRVSRQVGARLVQTLVQMRRDLESPAAGRAPGA